MKGKTISFTPSNYDFIFNYMADNTEGVFVPPIFLLVVIIDIAGHLGVNDTTADATICE
jgi:hypothetical protein